MKPIVNIDFNEVFANTKIYDELSAVIFGAELALRYSNTSDAQIREVKANIVRSAFNTFSLDYEKMAAATQPAAAPAAQYEYATADARAADTPSYTESPDSYDSGASEYDYFSNTQAQPAPRHSNPAPPDSGDINAYSYQAPISNEFEDINDNYEQTVVYENYPDPTKRASYDPEPPDGFGNLQENIWGEPEGNQNENAAFGKIQWTTYSSGANPGDDPSGVSYNRFDTNSEVSKI